jgi:hypothetical protein
MNAIQQGKTPFFPSSLSGFRWQEGLSNWEAGWSGDKKGWCCSHQQIGCPGYKYHGANAQKHVVVTWKLLHSISIVFLLMFSWEPKTCFFFLPWIYVFLLSP